MLLHKARCPDAEKKSPPAEEPRSCHYCAHHPTHAKLAPVMERQPFGRTGLTVPTVAAIRAAFRAHGGGWGQI